MSNSVPNFIYEKIGNLLDLHYREIKPGGHTAIITALQELVLAFGNCTKCWGKGYSTQYDTSIIVEGKDGLTAPNKTNIIACKCERGRSLEHLLKDLHGLDI